MDKLKKAFAEDPEALNAINQRESSQMFQNLIDKLSFLSKGEPGYTPRKGVDYFTPEEIRMIHDRLYTTLKQEVTPVKGVDYFDGMDGESIVGPMGPAGKDGRDGIQGEQGPKGDSIVGPAGKDGLDGTSPTIDEEELAKELIKIIRKKRLLSSDDISGMQGFSKDGINYRFEELMHGGGGTGGGSITYSIDLSSQCDGNNKVFTVPTNTNFIQLTGTDAPIVYKYVTDYTGSGTTTLTMTAAVNAPSTGATLILMYIV